MSKQTLFDRMADRARADREAAGDFRRTLAHIATTPLEGEPNFDGPLVPADARRFVRMAREILATHPERSLDSHTNAEKEG